MKWISFFSLFFCNLFANTITLEPNGVLTTFPISPKERVVDVITLFNTLYNTPDLLIFPKVPSYYQIALQTTRNGLLINVIDLKPATGTLASTDSTMLLVTYYPQGQRTGAKTSIPSTSLQYAAIPIEQVVEMVFSTSPISPSAMFTSTAAQGTLPIFSVDMAQRSLDIQNAFTFFNSIPNASSTAWIGLQTTLSGPFYAGNLANGEIKYVYSISTKYAPNGTILFVAYQDTPPVKGQPQTAQGNLNYIIVAPDQVYGIVYNPGGSFRK